MVRVMSEGKRRWVVVMVRWRRRRRDEAGRRQSHGRRVMISRVMMNGIGEEAASRKTQRIRLLLAPDARLEIGGRVAARTGWDGGATGGSDDVSDRRRRSSQRNVGIVRIDERFGSGTQRPRSVSVVHQKIDVVVWIVSVRAVIGSVTLVGRSTACRRARRIVAAVVVTSVTSHSPKRPK